MTDGGVELREAIAEELAARLARDEEVALGLGTFSVREYQPYEGRNPRTGEVVHVAAKRLVFFKVGQALREYVSGDSGREPGADARRLVTETARASRRSREEVEAALSGWVAQVARRLRKGEWVAFGSLGFFGVIQRPEAVATNPQTGEEIRISAHTVITFRPSRSLAKRVDRAPAPPVLPRGAVKEVLDAFPRRPLATVSDARQWLGRVGVATGGRGAVHALFERHLGRSTPPLAALLLSTGEGAQRLAVRPLSTVELLEKAIDDSGLTLESPHMPAGEVALMVPFAQDRLDEYWYTCQHAAPEDDAWVFQLTDVGEHSHQHTLVGWTSGVLLVAALEQIHPGGVLHPEDAERALSRLGDLGSPLGPRDLPY